LSSAAGAVTRARLGGLRRVQRPDGSSAKLNTTFPYPATVTGFIVAAVASSIRLIAATDTNGHSNYRRWA
jgi:hypothetical protein